MNAERFLPTLWFRKDWWYYFVTYQDRVSPDPAFGRRNPEDNADDRELLSN